MRVLVVDDEKLSRLTTRRQLRGSGFYSEAAPSANMALALLEQEPWDVVLTDLRMPGMDGIELLEQITKYYPSVDVIIMSAYGTNDSAVQAMRKGAFDYLTKPFPFDELHARLDKLADCRKLKQELSTLRQPQAAPTPISTPDTTDRLFTLHLAGRDSIPFQQILADLERELIDWALEQAEGNQTEAAKRLGLKRTTLQSKLKLLLD